MCCDISIMLSADVFIILKARLNLTEKWCKAYNEPCKGISHSYTKCNVGKDVLFCEGCTC